MAISAVLWQFGFGFLCVFIRFAERPAFRCLTRCGRCFRRCGSCLYRCFACLCPCCCGGPWFSTCRRPCAALFRPLIWACSHLKLRWYWLLLANNVGFMIREFSVISMLHGWSLEVVAAYVSIWLTMVLVLWEVWRFSSVRPRAPKTVDQVLDMLLLPLNYGIFMLLCVRILKLQNSEENQEMVTAVIDSADIWESWALWSVLELFVLVVENAAKRDPLRVNDAEYLTTIKAFKTLSLHGVKAFFLILFVFTSVDVLVKGVIAPAVPTFCFWFYKDCMTCSAWYHLHINPVAQSIIYIMCSFALIFVFTFERMFSDYLHCIQPYWKFWGVKLVVSVTYFQWLVISYCFGLESRQVYLTHCLICCVEMPLLAVLHATCAYPYGKAWLERLLDHVPAAAVDQLEEPAEIEDQEPAEIGDQELHDQEQGDAEVHAHDPEAPAPVHHAGVPDRDDVDDSSGAQAVDGPVAPASPGAPVRAPQEEEPAPRQCYSLIMYLMIWVGCCYGAIRLIDWVIPPDWDLGKAPPVYNFTCNDQDLGSLVEKRSDLHWLLPPRGEGQLQIPGTAGVWLPLCGSTLVACNIGYQGNPTVSCTANGEYSWNGACQEVVCGPPLKLPHAEAKYDHQAWTSGMKVKYSCDKGWHGSPVAICGKDGNYSVQGACTEVVCGTPPSVPHSGIPPAPSLKWKEGMQVRYQCEPPYHGKPVGVCGSDEVWTVSGHCQITCATPPVLPNAIPDFDFNMTHPIGSRLKYKCNDQYGGHPVAVCDASGTYRVEGSCERVCGEPLEVPHGIAKIDVEQAKRGFKVGAELQYWCDAGYGGDPVAECGDDGQWTWKVAEADRCTYLGCGSRDNFLAKNVSNSWKDIMTVKEELNFTSSDDGDVVFYRCNPGYSGSPVVTCQKGRWRISGSCAVACGPPPQIGHAVPSFNVTKAQHGWTVGMRVTYRCDAGYGGKPIVECSPDGEWKFVDADRCVDYECGSLESYLSTVDRNWQDTMRVHDMINVTTSDYGDHGPGDVVFFRCQPGYAGKPLASCAKGSWQLRDAPKPYATSLGCACKTNWTFCNGWLGTKCQRWHGCTVRALGDSYGWCEVEGGSCPQGGGPFKQAPSWDYCAEGSSANTTWVPEYVADVGLPMQIRLVLYALICVGGAVASFYLYRAAKAYHMRRLRGDRNADVYGTSFTSARGLSLPELPIMPEASPTLGDASSETSSPEQLSESRPSE